MDTENMLEYLLGDVRSFRSSEYKTAIAAVDQKLSATPTKSESEILAKFPAEYIAPRFSRALLFTFRYSPAGCAALIKLVRRGLITIERQGEQYVWRKRT